jgi:biotin carboxyl carrier protein
MAPLVFWTHKGMRAIFTLPKFSLNTLKGFEGKALIISIIVLLPYFNILIFKDSNLRYWHMNNAQSMFKAAVSKSSFEITSDGDALFVNGVPLDWDLTKISEGRFHILLENRSYRAEVIRTDRNSKSVVININGRIYTVELKDKLDLLLDEMGLNSGSAGKVNNVKAPMPGLIIDLRVTQGDTVKTGDPLLVLEAMKMENVLKSPGDGTVKSIKVKRGDSVEKNQVLIEF